MNLQAALDKIDDLDTDSTIWIDGTTEWSSDSTVVLAVEKEEGGAPESVPKHFEYFLEVFTTADLIHDLKNSGSNSFSVDRVIYYAVNDA